jgi:hypothetical protein
MYSGKQRSEWGDSSADDRLLVVAVCEKAVK